MRKPSCEKVPHAPLLRFALNIGESEHYQEILLRLAAKEPLDKAGALFTTTYWNPVQRHLAKALMHRYMDAGYFRVNDLVIADPKSYDDLLGRRGSLLGLALGTRTCGAAEVLIERGALECKGVVMQLKASMSRSSNLKIGWPPADATPGQVVEGFVHCAWSADEAPEVMARLTETMMRRQLQAGESRTRADSGQAMKGVAHVAQVAQVAHVVNSTSARRLRAV